VVPPNMGQSDREKKVPAERLKARSYWNDIARTALRLHRPCNPWIEKSFFGVMSALASFPERLVTSKSHPQCFWTTTTFFGEPEKHSDGVVRSCLDRQGIKKPALRPAS
jgi:hypothetical protein